MSFVLHAIFFSNKRLQEIFFKITHPSLPPPLRVKWSAPYIVTTVFVDTRLWKQNTREKVSKINQS